MIANTFCPEDDQVQPLVVQLSGEIDVTAAASLEIAIAPLAAAPIAILHLADVTFADTTLLNAVERVVHERGAHRRSDVRLRIVGASHLIVRMFEIAQIGELVRFFSSLDDAHSDWSPATFRRIKTVEHGGYAPSSV